MADFFFFFLLGERLQNHTVQVVMFDMSSLNGEMSIRVLCACSDMWMCILKAFVFRNCTVQFSQASLGLSICVARNAVQYRRWFAFFLTRMHDKIAVQLVLFYVASVVSGFLRQLFSPEEETWQYTMTYKFVVCHGFTLSIFTFSISISLCYLWQFRFITNGYR